jgi:hypothetical protein
VQLLIITLVCRMLISRTILRLGNERKRCMLLDLIARSLSETSGAANMDTLSVTASVIARAPGDMADHFCLL